MEVYVVFMLFGVMATMLFGSVGCYIYYRHEENKKSKKKTEKFNPMASAGWFSF